MKRYVEIKFSNGDKFRIPATTIAHARATHYANHDEGEQKGEHTDEWMEVYKDERAYTLGDKYELTDWLWNNMDWKDVKEDAIAISEKQDYDHDKHWMEITEDDSNYEVVDEP